MVRIWRRKEFMRTHGKLQPRGGPEDEEILTKESRTEGENESNKLSNELTINSDTLTVSDSPMSLDISCSDLSRSSIDANSLANISFSFLLRNPTAYRDKAHGKREHDVPYEDEKFFPSVPALPSVV